MPRPPSMDPVNQIPAYQRFANQANRTYTFNRGASQQRSFGNSRPPWQNKPFGGGGNFNRFGGGGNSFRPGIVNNFKGGNNFNKNRESNFKNDSLIEPVFFDLGFRKRLKVKPYNGTIFIDIREYFMQDNKMLPTKKGTSMNKEMWDKFVE